MGLRDWIAGNVAGPRAYGKALGRQTVMEGARGLSNSAFFNHGARPKESDASVRPGIFDTVSDMEAAGFKHRYEETFKIVIPFLPLDEQVLCRNLHEGMVPYTYLLVSSIASSFMQRDNSARFCDGLTLSVSRAMADCGLYPHHAAAREALLSHMRLYEAASNSAILDAANPACGDFLESCLLRCAEVSSTQSQYAFSRTGACQLKSIAITLFEETLKSMFAATNQFKW
jgi:hypothetical protein